MTSSDGSCRSAPLLGNFAVCGAARRGPARLHPLRLLPRGGNQMSPGPPAVLPSLRSGDDTRRSSRRMQAENMHVHLYRDLRISPEQAFRFAAVWHRWLRDRRALGGIRTAALAILNTLPASVPTLDFTHISRLASGSVQHVHVCTYCAGAGAHAELAAHAGHACSHKEGRHRVCDGPVCSSCGAAVDGGEGDAPGLLGEDYRSTCRAAAAMRHLRHLLDAATKVSLSLMSTQWQPGGVMTAQQLTCMARRALRSNGPPIDFMVLCQLAATQERRWELRRWPEVLTKPLPLRM